MARKSRKNTVNTQPEILNTAVYIRTAQYIRLSVEDSHNKGNSIENQKMILDDFITRNGNMRLAGVYIDEHVIIGTSGENLVKSRGSALVPFSFLLRDKPKPFKSLKIINERL